MFVGQKGKILAGFFLENPRLIPERRMHGLRLRACACRERSRARLRRACANGWLPPEADSSHHLEAS